MLIEQIDIVGFKGINQLSLRLNPEFSVLIGENRWGRSSLISALTLLSFDNQLYHFVDADFYHDEQAKCCDNILIKITYCESHPNELDSQDYQPLWPVVISSSLDHKRRITYKITGDKQNGRIISEHFFVNSLDERFNIEDEKSLIATLISLNPVLRLKNAINIDNNNIDNGATLHKSSSSEYYIEQLSNQLKTHSTELTQEELHRGLQAASALLEYYFVDQQRRHHYKNIAKKNSPQAADWSSLEHINNTLDNLNNDYLRRVLLSILNSIVDAKGHYSLSKSAVPILVLEEPESLLHPIILSIGFRLLNNLPTQKIVTSNSSDLVSLFPLDSIYHLIRLQDHIVVKSIAPNTLSIGDSRRILFHILYRHSRALFARCWLLVEGETEVWLLRELAQQSGYHLSSEGIQLIEFAQCGLRPLIKYASEMGIDWYVITDGDEAGKKYANTVRSFCSKNSELDNYLTLLPALDIENFLFKHGFSHVYKLAAYNTTDHIDMPISKIIQKAIHKSSKPDLAIAVCDDAKARGVNAIPSLLRHTFEKIVKKAQLLTKYN